MWGALLPIAGAALGLGYSGYQSYLQNQTDQKNYKLQKEQFEYQKSLQQTMFQREDNATQRRAADLQAAGLSKTLAAGNAAQAGPVVKTDVPQMASKGREMAMQTGQQSFALALDIARSRADISKTMADTEVSRQTARKVGLDADLAADTYHEKELQAVALTNNMSLDALNKKLDSQIAEFKIQMQDIEKEKARLAVDAARLGMDQKRLDIAAKQVAIDNAKYNREWYETQGLPIQSSITGNLQNASVVSKFFENLINGRKGITPEEVQKRSESRDVKSSRGGAR